jgi:chitinase
MSISIKWGLTLLAFSMLTSCKQIEVTMVQESLNPASEGETASSAIHNNMDNTTQSSTSGVADKEPANMDYKDRFPEWDPIKHYAVLGDTVLYEGVVYIHQVWWSSGKTPNANPDTWQKIQPQAIEDVADHKDSTGQKPGVVNPVEPGTLRKDAHTVIGYYASWQWYDRNKMAAPSKIDFAKWSRVNFAFFHPDDEGGLHGTDSWADPQVLFGPANWNPAPGAKEICFSTMGIHGGAPTQTCGHYQLEQGLIHLAHQVGTEVWPSIGGWTLSGKFPAIAANATKRARFASESVKLLRDFGFDGIDIDWEYPGFTPHNGTAQDKVNFVKLMQAVRDSIDAYGKTLTPARRFGLSAALPCGEPFKDIDVPALKNILDEFNLMSYDFFGAWDPIANHNTPLFAGEYGDSGFNVVACAQKYIAAGASAKSIRVGAGFYGRSFIGAKKPGDSHSGSDTRNWSVAEGMPMYYEIMEQNNLVHMWDDKAKVPWAYFPEGGMVSFENEKSLQIKTNWMKQHGIGGIIVWEMSGDIMTDGTTPLSDVLKQELNP